MRTGEQGPQTQRNCTIDHNIVNKTDSKSHHITPKNAKTLFKNPKCKKNFLDKKCRKAIDYFVKFSPVANSKLRTQVASSSSFRKIYTGKDPEPPVWSLKRFQDIDQISKPFGSRKKSMPILTKKKSTLKQQLRFTMGKMNFNGDLTSSESKNPLLEQPDILTLTHQPNLLKSTAKRMETWDSRVNLAQRNSPQDQANRILNYMPIKPDIKDSSANLWDVSVKVKKQSGPRK